MEDVLSYETKGGDTEYVHESDSNELVEDFFSQETILKKDAFSTTDPDTDEEVYSYKEFATDKDGDLVEAA